VPPDLLRAIPEQNYLSVGARSFGFTCFAVVLFTSAVFIVWVYLHRDRRVVKAAQPIFLYMICVGAALSASAIFTRSFDESFGWSEQQLSRACMASVWLFSSGYIIIYGALFAKLWRINRVLQFTRRTIEVKQVAGPSLLLVLTAVIILCVWTAVDPLRWQRQVIDDVTGESIARCHADSILVFAVALLCVMLVPTLLTEWMAWTTKDIDEEFSESMWIFIMILVQCEAILFSVPMLALLRDVSTNARYIGTVILIWTLPTSSLALIIGPKVFAFRRGRRGSSVRRTNRGSVTGAVHISGLMNPSARSEGLEAKERPVGGDNIVHRS
jgi:gamma-aminobutyric acid type B receptor